MTEMMTTDRETTAKPSPVHGTPAWWRLWADYRESLGRVTYLIDLMRSDEMVHGKGLERYDGYDQCLARLDEASASIQKARDARRRINELAAPEHEKSEVQ